MSVINEVFNVLGQRKATSGSTKRKVNFQDSATVKRQKVLSTKTLNHRPLLGQQMSGISASLSKQKAGPKSVQEKWKAQASMSKWYHNTELM